VVSATGTVENVADTHCFGNPGDDRRRSIFLKKKVVDSQFEPATIDGKAVEVFVSFRVLFQETSGSCDVKVVQNLGIQADELGIDYFAPQEILTDGGWMLPIEDAITYREPDWWGLVFSMSVAVDEQGNASDGRVETNNFATEESVRLAVESLEKQRFIPAFVEGVPRAARYEEYLYIAQPAPRRRY
jgi:hypothetical protein